MSQYAHRVTVNNNGTVSINLASHDDVTVAVFLNHKTCGSWTAVDFASLDAAEKMAQDMLAAIKQRRSQLIVEDAHNEATLYYSTRSEYPTAIDADYEQALADMTPPNPNPGPAWEAKELCPADVNDSDDPPF